MVQQKGECVVDSLRAYGVVVVEHEDEVARHLQDLVAECGEDGLKFLPRLQGAQESTRGCPEVLVDRPDGGNQVQEEADRIVVPFVQRDPGYRKFASPAPVREQSRLAETGRRGDDGQLASYALIQPLVEARTRHGIRTTTGHVELGLEYLPVREFRFSHRKNCTRRSTKSSIAVRSRKPRGRGRTPYAGCKPAGGAAACILR